MDAARADCAKAFPSGVRLVCPSKQVPRQEGDMIFRSYYYFDLGCAAYVFG